MTSIARGLIGMMNPINMAVKWVLGGLLAAMALLIGWQIFARFFIGGGLDFSEEAARFIMVWLVLLGAGYAVKEHRLIRVDALERLLTGVSQSMVMVTAWVVCIVFYVLLIWFGTSMAVGVSYQLAPASEISMTWAISALPAGGLLMLLNTLYAMSRYYLGEPLNGDVGNGLGGKSSESTADDSDQGGDAR